LASSKSSIEKFERIRTISRSINFANFTKFSTSLEFSLFDYSTKIIAPPVGYSLIFLGKGDSGRTCSSSYLRIFYV